MDTKEITINPACVDRALADEAGKILREGGVVAFPTETVYGLGASAFLPDAVARVFEAKGRPSDNPLIVHVADREDIEPLVLEIPEKAKLVIKHFMPGPISIILKKSEKIPDVISAGLDTVAIRMPENAVAREIIRSARVPIAAPSANTSGKPSPTLASHVRDDLYGKIDMIVDGGACKVGVESTVIDMTADPPVILRPGAITAPMLEEIIGKVVSPSQAPLAKEDIPKCPGMKYKHYAPKARVVVIEYTKLDTMLEELKKLIRFETRKGSFVGVISDGADDYAFAPAVLVCGSDAREYAKGLFKTLRDFDELGADVVFAPIRWTDPFMSAVRNRIYKSAANNVIRL